MAEGNEIDLIGVTSRTAVHLEEYDCIGFASDICCSKLQETVLNVAQQYLPRGKDVFFVYSCGSMRKGYTKGIAEAVTAKGHPNADALQKAKAFYQSICRKP